MPYGVVISAISTELLMPQLNQLAEHYCRELLSDPAMSLVLILSFPGHQLQIELPISETLRNLLRGVSG
ncbi:hypothetical protein GL2_33760 [Microbulbifer sp. GL-2]|nr:hypothetical protein GL2_33760 [Microbulbifer sp. GL-2]